MHIHKNAFCPWRQSAFTYFLNSRGSEWRMCSTAHTTNNSHPHLHHRKSTAKQPTALSCHGCCPDPQEDCSLCPPAWPHRRQTRRTFHTERLGAVGPNLGQGHKAAMKAFEWKWEDTEMIFICSDATVGGNNIYFLCTGRWAVLHCQLLNTMHAFVSFITSAEKGRKHCSPIN